MFLDSLTTTGNILNLVLFVVFPVVLVLGAIIRFLFEGEANHG